MSNLDKLLARAVFRQNAGQTGGAEIEEIARIDDTLVDEHGRLTPDAMEQGRREIARAESERNDLRRAAVRQSRCVS